MSEPDLSTLPRRIRYAAGVLTEVRNHALDLHRGDDFKSRYSWDVGALMRCADVWEENADRAKAEQDMLTEQLAREMYAAGGSRDCPTQERLQKAGYMSPARKLIESGWRKA